MQGLAGPTGCKVARTGRWSAKRAATNPRQIDATARGRLLTGGASCKGYDAERRRDLCREFGAKPRIHRRGLPRGSGLGKRRWPVERSLAWLLENRRLALRYDRLGFVVQSALQGACVFLVAGRLAREF